MATDQRFDLSTERIPSAWKEAAREAPPGSEGPLRTRAAVQWVPDRNQVDNFPAMLTAVVMCSIVGYIWYEVELARGDFQQWMALILGAVAAIAIRLGGGRSNYQYRAGLSIVFYAFSLAVIFYLLGRTSYITVYGRAPSYLDLERHFLNGRLTDIPTVAACLGGAAIAIAISYMTRPHVAT